MVKAGYAIAPGEFKAKFELNGLGWSALLADLAEIGEASAVPFELCRTSPNDYVKQIVASTEANTEKMILADAPVNEGIGESTLALMSYLNKNTEMSAAARSGFRKLAAQVIPNDKRPNFFSSSERASIVSICADDNQRILKICSSPQYVCEYYSAIPMEKAT